MRVQYICGLGGPVAPPDLHVDAMRWLAETLRAFRLQSDQGCLEQLHTEQSSTQSGLHYFPSSPKGKKIRSTASIAECVKKMLVVTIRVLQMLEDMPIPVHTLALLAW